MSERIESLIVRIVGKDLDGSQPVYKALTGIKGINHRMGRIIAYAFEKESKIPFDERLGNVDEKFYKILEEIILSPEKFGIPIWVYNRQKDFESGKSEFKVMAELDLAKRRDLMRLQKIKSYRGIRHALNLPVRGQRTRSSFRKKGATVGVLKKEAKAKMQPAKSEKK